MILKAIYFSYIFKQVIYQLDYFILRQILKLSQFKWDSIHLFIPEGYNL